MRKGERATPVVYWKWRTPEELAQRAAQTGKEDPAPCTPFVSAVFNFDQVEGVTRPEDDLPPRPEDRLRVAELMLDVMPDKPKIVHTLTAQPAYSPSLDRITMPHLSQFESADEYFSTLYHELVHLCAESGYVAICVACVSRAAFGGSHRHISCPASVSI